jgi:hypothetical protein
MKTARQHTSIAKRNKDFESFNPQIGRARSVEATGRVYFPIAWLPPGLDPGAGRGAATTARQRDRI